MTQTSGHCLGCGRELADVPSYHGNAYRVCGECADIMRQGNHKDFFKVVKAVSKSLDDARAENRLISNTEQRSSVWINAIGL